MDFAALRLNMVDNQLRTNEVFDLDILDAMGRLPREAFVASTYRSLAYSDQNVPVPGGSDRKLMAPTAACRLVQACEAQANDVALVIGCGSGFTSALLGQLVSSVVAIESDAQLSITATDILSDLGIENAVVVEAPLESGLKSEGPFDIILFDGAVDFVPDVIVDQLREGGRLVAVEGNGLSAPVKVYRRFGETVSGTAAFNLSVPHLPGFIREAEFVF